MIKKIIITLCSLLLCLLPAITAISQEGMERVSNAVFSSPQRPMSVFYHEAHNENAGLDDCSICHHVYEEKRLLEGESSEDRSCSDCHGLLKNEKNSVPLINAYHKRCKTCHLKTSSAPLLCGECHKQNN
jgi:hypothetical protein